MRLFVILVLLVLFSLVSMIFYYQEVQYLKPTPRPASYQPPAIGSRVALETFGVQKRQKPILLHFYNPDCPCSNYNSEHFGRLLRLYGADVDFYAVLQTADKNRPQAVEKFRDAYLTSIPVLFDNGEQLAQACGIYATPQAVLLDQNGLIYYRGNYNESSFCAAPGTSFAQLAIKSLLQGRPAPQFADMATTAYGCELPSQQKQGLALIF